MGIPLPLSPPLSFSLLPLLLPLFCSPHDPTNETGGPRNSGFDPTNEPTNGPQEPIKEPIKLGKEPISARVLEHVRQHPGEKRDGIVKALGISLSTARRALKALDGQVEYRGSKKTGGYFAKDD